MINQQEFIRKYNDTHREHFNEELFIRNDDDIVREIENVILSCQRNRVFTIKVLNFNIVDDYNEINRLLREYETNNYTRKKSLGNKYDHIQIKNSDIRLLIVDYYLEVYNTDEVAKRSKVLKVYIEIPRVVDKFYFKIGGNLDISMSQVIESTYNNSSVNNNGSVGMVANKTKFMASRFFRFDIENSKDAIKLETIDKRKMKGVCFSSIIFNKSVHAMKYLLAKYGVYGTKKKLMVPYLNITNYIPEVRNDNKLYIVKKGSLYISVPEFVYDNDPVTQSLFYTICHEIDNEADMNNIFTRDYWLVKLGKSFGSKTVEKGYSILESLESICDISSMEKLRLPKSDKEDIYDIIVWIVREFSELRLKDNLDISMKRQIWAEYFACIYAYKLAKGLYRISDRGNKVTLQSIEKAINIFPDYLIRAISKDKLVNPGNMANDLDSVSALKYTYKGVSGLGEDGTSIPGGYRQVHPSHLGRVDLDSSSNSDPGMTGTVCPISDINNGAFGDTPEPNDWREKIEELHSNYKDMYGLKEALFMKVDLGLGDENDKSRIAGLEESMSTMKSLINPLSSLDKHLYGNKLFSEVLWDDNRNR